MGVAPSLAGSLTTNHAQGWLYLYPGSMMSIPHGGELDYRCCTGVVLRDRRVTFWWSDLMEEDSMYVGIEGWSAVHSCGHRRSWSLVVAYQLHFSLCCLTTVCPLDLQGCGWW